MYNATILLLFFNDIGLLASPGCVSIAKRRSEAFCALTMPLLSSFSNGLPRDESALRVSAVFSATQAVAIHIQNVATSGHSPFSYCRAPDIMAIVFVSGYSDGALAS